ncbi:hypothetical protein H6P81_005281 [Aristolochia fimbriata]|uniref:Flavin-containing monooxygenase n=1 Tax=Aristolochia fimbriata TaxID=158543 RepID=A0AAV7EU46_ARIFI|nr:hypothetical protein H6P81_005281 [Aristolochia fimbriata]
MAQSCKVAVIGAGVAGLVAARELIREGHHVVIFEKGDRIGGTWIYDPRIENDPLGLNPDREIVHSSLYRSLRTNLPRRIMGFSDYPFKVRDEGGDSREFPGHEEVLSYLERFARDFELTDLTRFKTEVTCVRMGTRKDEWLVESRRRKACSGLEPGSEVEMEIFQAVVVCNGHFVEPRIAAIPGIGKWPGKQIHSHNYRMPEPFKDQIVVVIGSGPSAFDISRDIAKVAKEVHLASRSPDIEVGKVHGLDNVWQHLMIESVNEDGSVIFLNGTSTFADTILHCTGYKYHFPFMEIDKIVTVEDNRVGPLYKHVFPPSLAPWLSFIGLPSKVIPFLSAELQAKWLGQILADKVTLPTEEDMLASVNEYYSDMEEMGKPKHHTHVLYPFELQSEYKNWLRAQVGLPPLEQWIWETYVATLKRLISLDDGFREKEDFNHDLQTTLDTALCNCESLTVYTAARESLESLESVLPDRIASSSENWTAIDVPGVDEFRNLSFFIIFSGCLARKESTILGTDHEHQSGSSHEWNSILCRECPTRYYFPAKTGFQGQTQTGLYQNYSS